uniref:Uncharacterized protein n=1 Tax=Ditylenchus dipsaci TaxID=166011 RepID=A0A915D686_9BILA
MSIAAAIGAGQSSQVLADSMCANFDDLRFDSINNFGRISEELDLVPENDSINHKSLGMVNSAFAADSNDEVYDIPHEESQNIILNWMRNKSMSTQIYRKPYPPFPSDDTEPIRVMPSGWREYKTLGGR